MRCNVERCLWKAYRLALPDAERVGEFVGYLVTDGDPRRPEPVALLPKWRYGLAAAIALGREEPGAGDSVDIRSMLEADLDALDEGRAELLTFAYERIDFDPATLDLRPVEADCFAGFRYVCGVVAGQAMPGYFWWTRGVHDPFPKEESGTPTSPVTPAPGSNGSDKAEAPTAA